MRCFLWYLAVSKGWLNVSSDCYFRKIVGRTKEIDRIKFEVTNKVAVENKISCVSYPYAFRARCSGNILQCWGYTDEWDSPGPAFMEPRILWG